MAAAAAAAAEARDGTGSGAENTGAAAGAGGGLVAANSQGIGSASSGKSGAAAAGPSQDGEALLFLPHSSPMHELLGSTTSPLELLSSGFFVPASPGARLRALVWPLGIDLRCDPQGLPDLSAYPAETEDYLTDAGTALGIAPPQASLFAAGVLGRGAAAVAAGSQDSDEGGHPGSISGAGKRGSDSSGQGILRDDSGVPGRHVSRVTRGGENTDEERSPSQASSGALHEWSASACSTLLPVLVGLSEEWAKVRAQLADGGVTSAGSSSSRSSKGDFLASEKNTGRLVVVLRAVPVTIGWKAPV